MPDCTHPHRHDVAEVGFSGSVAVHPCTTENRAAHGCVRTTVECLMCGARRHENRNWMHREVGPWWPHREEQEASQRERRRHLRTIRTAYGIRDVHDDRVAGVIVLRPVSGPEIVIGTTLADAARRTATADGAVIRDTITLLRDGRAS